MAWTFPSRDYGRPDEAFIAKVQALPKTNRAGFDAHVGSAELDTGEIVDCVYFVDAVPYIKIWGVWPEGDRGKRPLDWRLVKSVRPSPYAMPRELDTGRGEYAMGAMAFEISFADGAKFSCVTGDATDFVSLPDGYLASDAVATTAITGEAVREVRFPQPQFYGAEYHWCLMGEYPKQSKSN